MSGRLLYLRGRLLQVEERAAARGAGYEFGLRVAHATSLQEGETGVPEEVDAEAHLVSDLLDQDAVAVTVNEEGSDLRPELECELVRVGRRRAVVVDGGDLDVVGLEDLEYATGCVQLGQGVGDAYGHHEGIEVLHLGDGRVVLAAVDLHGESDGPGRELYAPDFATNGVVWRDDGGGRDT